MVSPLYCELKYDPLWFRLYRGGGGGGGRERHVYYGYETDQT